MKGYRMVLLVNGGIFLFIALNAFLLAHILIADADRCAEQTSTTGPCDQTRDTATTALRVAPVVGGAGVVLLLLGSFLGRESPAEPLGHGSRSRMASMTDDWSKALHESPDGIVIDVEVVPNASSPGFPVGYNPWRKRVQARVAAPAEQGLANEELIVLVAASFNISRDRVALIDGHTSRRKRVAVRGVTVADFTRIVAEAPGGR